MTFGKLLISKVTFTDPVWSSVLYTNILALPVLSVMASVSGELPKLMTVSVGLRGMMALVISIFGGVGISWAGWNCRAKVSATAYTLLGVLSKLVSVALNIMIWDKHATPWGLCWLVVCIVSGSFYRQSPLRASYVVAAEMEPIPQISPKSTPDPS